jgi:hypothetical protein
MMRLPNSILNYYFYVNRIQGTEKTAKEHT